MYFIALMTSLIAIIVLIFITRNLIKAFLTIVNVIAIFWAFITKKRFLLLKISNHGISF